MGQMQPRSYGSPRVDEAAQAGMPPGVGARRRHEMCHILKDTALTKKTIICTWHGTEAARCRFSTTASLMMAFMDSRPQCRALRCST